jgi:flagellar hook-length control protein FliK
MKVPSPDNAAQVQDATDGSISPKSREFSSVLREKKAEADDEQPAAAAAGAELLTPMTIQGEAFEELSAKPLTEYQLPLLAGEIAAEVTAASATSATATVEIRFDSRTLGGLEVRITMKDRDLAIQFSPAAPQTYALLTRRAPELRTLLAERGYRVKDVRVASSLSRRTR